MNRPNAFCKIIVTIIFSHSFNFLLSKKNIINPFASPRSGAPALKYGDVNIVTPSLGEVKGLIIEPSNFALMLSQAYAPSLSSILM